MLPDLLIFLLVLGIILGILGVITVIGHGIWVLLAWIFRGFRGRPKGVRRPCGYCGQPTPVGQPHCDWCGRDLRTPTAAELSDLQGLERQLHRFVARGALKKPVAESLLARVQRYRQQLFLRRFPKPPLGEAAKEEPVEAIVIEEAPPPKPAAPPGRRPPVPAAPAKPPEVEAARPATLQPPRAASVEPARPSAAVAPPPPAPAAPRRSWKEMLAAFMEERNIRIGELLGGLLFVGSSVALVLSLRETLAEIKYSPFLIFAVITSAFFGAGLYTHHRWKLASTSRGLMTIAMLLVPLNFLVIARCPRDEYTLLTLLLELGSLALFTWLLGLAARVLVPSGRWLAVAAVVGNSAVLLAVPWLVGPQMNPVLGAALGCLPVAVFAGAVGGALHVTRTKDRLDAAAAAEHFTLLGCGAFALTFVLGLHLAKVAGAVGWKAALECLSVPIALSAVPIAAVGLRIARRMAARQEWEPYRTTGTTIAVLGVALQVVALGLAWPQPAGIMVVGAINAVALMWLAFRYDFPVAHVAAIVCIAMAYLAGFHLLFDETLRSLPREELKGYMLRLCVSARSGTALGGLFVLFAAVSELLARAGRRSHGRVYLGGCGAVAILGLTLVTAHGLLSAGTDALRATCLYGVYGAGSLALLGRWRRAELSYFGLALLAAAPIWFLWYRTGQLGPPWATVLAIEALALGAIAAVLYGRLRHDEAWSPLVPGPTSVTLADYYRIPMLHVAEVLSVAAIVLATLTQSTAAAPLRELVWATLTFAALAALYLLSAWGYRHPRRFAVHQLLAIIAVLLGVTAWLEHSGKLTAISWQILHPHHLQAYGIGLGLLMLAYAAARIACTRVGGDSGRRWLAITAAGLPRPATDRQQTVGDGSRLLQHPEGLPVDWIVRHLLVWLQLAVIAAYLLPGFAQELLPRGGTPGAFQLAAGGTGAWLLLGVLAAVMITALWERWGKAELIGTLLLAATVPCLLAWQFIGSLAVASAARWGLAMCFIVCSAAVWDRGRVLAWCRQLGTNVDPGTAGPPIARATLLITTALPVLGLTILAAFLQFIGVAASGPAAGSFFARLGPNVSYVLPLLLVMFAMVGHAVRERSAGYAFAAGGVAELIVTMGYALSVVTGAGARPFGVDEFVTLLQLATITAAAWAIAWLIVRRRLDIWRETVSADVPSAAKHGAVSADVPSAAKQTGVGPETFSGRRYVGRTPTVLMNIQLALGIAGNALLLVVALGTMALLHQWGRGAMEWTVAAGRPLGWIALVSVAAAFAYRRMQAGRMPRPNLVGLFGMSVLGLLGCTVEAYWPGWGYRTLMLGWAAFALFIVSAMWWVASVRTLADAHGPPQALLRAAAVWVRVAGILAVLLGLKAALFHGSWEELLWAAAAISTASLAGATMAVWRRREGWAFAAALGVNLAASLVAWYLHQNVDRFGDWWLRLVQTNVIASSGVALVWLAVRKRLYELRALTVGESPLLAVQVALPAAGNVVLLLTPVVALLQMPDFLHEDFARLAEPAGWVALLAAAAAAAWYLRQARPGNLMHVLGSLGLGAGVLAACHAAGFADASDLWWLEYHTLCVAWAIAGMLVLAIGMLGRDLRVFPGSYTQGWVTAIAALTVLFSVIYSGEDRLGAWFYLWAILSVSLTTGIVALWRRQPIYVFISGLLLCVIGSIAWMVWGPGELTALISANVLSLAVGSMVWTLLGAVHPSGVPHARLGDRPAVFAHLAALLAVGLLGLVAIVGVTRGVAELTQLQLYRLDWLALLAAVAAVTICLWDRTARFSLAGLYFLGLAAIGMVLVQRDLTSARAFIWIGTCDVTAFVLLTALLGWALPRLRPVWAALRIADDRDRWPKQWFLGTQELLAALLAVLAAWVSIDFAFRGTGKGLALFGFSGSAAGPPSALMLLGATILMAWQTRDATRAIWQYAAMAAGVLFTTSIGWSVLDQDSSAPWLHRSVNLMVSAAMMTLLGGFGLGQVLPKASDWIDRGRRAVPAFGSLAMLMLALILIQEAFAFADGALVATWAVVIVTIALAGLAAGCLGFALMPRWDPLELSDRGRTAYVYAAEALAGLICLHLGLTRPEWFDFGIIKEYWMLIVLSVAFAGAGLSELFGRRGLPVLSQPLERTALVLPIVPAVAFWFVPASASVFSPAYAGPLTWLAIGAFYGVLAANRRSLGLAALAIFAANTGLWVLWHRRAMFFFEYPQLWLIPIATAALVAEQLDRRRLSDAQRAAVRYAALSVIYVSSTTEFLRGLGESIWPPLVLITLCVLGVLAGILLRIRSFLYLGLSFLLVVIVRLIYYAAFEHGQFWVLWTFCIILATAIIAMFAVFEKRRNDVLEAMERFKEWE